MNCLQIGLLTEYCVIFIGILHNVICYKISNKYHIQQLSSLPLGGPFFNIPLIRALLWGIYGTWWVGLIPSILISYKLGGRFDNILELYNYIKIPLILTLSCYLFSLIPTYYNNKVLTDKISVADFHQNYGYFFGFTGIIGLTCYVLIN